MIPNLCYWRVDSTHRLGAIVCVEGDPEPVLHGHWGLSVHGIGGCMLEMAEI